MCILTVSSSFLQSRLAVQSYLLLFKHWEFSIHSSSYFQSLNWLFLQHFTPLQSSASSFPPVKIISFHSQFSPMELLSISLFIPVFLFLPHHNILHNRISIWCSCGYTRSVDRITLWILCPLKSRHQSIQETIHRGINRYMIPFWVWSFMDKNIWVFENLAVHWDF